MAQPIYWDSADALDATPGAIVRAVVSHNTVGEKLCDWGKPDATPLPSPEKN